MYWFWVVKKGHSLDLPFFKWGEVNFNYLPWRRESEKLEKEGGSIVQGQVFLKEGLALFLFNLLKVYHFYIQNYFTKSSSAAGHSLHQQLTSADISSQRLVHPTAADDFVICSNASVDKCLCCQADIWCILQLNKSSIVLWKKVILICLKMNLKISHKLR